jgi:hypothetical protein
MEERSFQETQYTNRFEKKMEEKKRRLMENGEIHGILIYFAVPNRMYVSICVMHGNNKWIKFLGSLKTFCIFSM